MNSQRPSSTFLAAAVAAAGTYVSASQALANKTPAQCGLPAGTPISGVTIRSCFDPGFDPIDVVIDRTIDMLYVSRYYDAEDPRTGRVDVYDISDPESPAFETSLEYDLQTQVHAIVGLAAGDGHIFGAVDCLGLDSATYCDYQTDIQGWNACDDWSGAGGGLLGAGILGNATWPHGIADSGMHTVSYASQQGLLFGGNNRIYDSDYSIPIWDVGWTCPMSTDPLLLLPVTNLPPDSEIHEVSYAEYMIGAAAWTRAVFYHVGGLPDDYFEIGRVSGTAIHTAYPNWPRFYVAEERVGGSLTRYDAENYLNPPFHPSALVRKDVRTLPVASGASYHEVLTSGSLTLASAYQAGMRGFRYGYWRPEQELAVYFDTTPDGCPSTGCGAISTWTGASGIDSSPIDSNQILVAVSNRQPASLAHKVYLLSVYAPNTQLCTDGFKCAAMSVTHYRQNAGGAKALVLAQSTFTTPGPTVGKVVKYIESATGPSSLASWNQVGLSPASDFGTSIAVGDFNHDAKNDLAVGAPGQVNAGGADAGRVYLYDGFASAFGPLGTLEPATPGSPGTHGGDRFGAAIVAGDFNNDFIDDLAVSAPRADEGNGIAGSGRVLLYKGTAVGGLIPWAVLGNAATPHEGDGFGLALTAADFNGDGIKDLAVGAPHGHQNALSAAAGFVSIYKGVTNQTPAFYVRLGQAGLDSDEPEDEFGYSLASGDINGDGKAELVVGAPGERVGDTSSGRIYLFVGNASSTLSPWIARDQTGLDANEEEDMFGRAVAIGDYDADGKFDVLVGASGEHIAGGPRAGVVYLFRGQSTTLLGVAKYGQTGLDTPGDLDGFGDRLAAGDWTLDGKMDFAILAPRIPAGVPSGASLNPLLVFKGGAAGLGALEAITPP
jgi:FG-GAP repeat